LGVPSASYLDFGRGTSNEGLGTQDWGLRLGVRANQTIGTPMTPASIIAAFSSLELANVLADL
jgi:hypothetical protein